MARRRSSNRRRRGSGFGFLSKLLSILAICGAIIVALTLFFRVDTITVSGQKRYTEQQIRDVTGVAAGDNLVLMNKYDVANRIISALPYIEETRISRELPDTLVISVRECGTPVAVEQEEQLWLISTSGKIVDQRPVEEAEDYCRIDGIELLAPSVGTKMAMASELTQKQENLLALLSALEAADELRSTEAIHLADPEVISMEYMGRFTVEMSYGADYPYKLRTLEAILASGKIQENMTGTFDMRREDGKTNFIQNTRE